MTPPTRTVKKARVDSSGRPWKAQNIIHADTAMKSTGLNGYPQARNGRSAPGRRTLSTITHETASAAKSEIVKPAYCWIWSTRPERMISDVTTPCATSATAGAPLGRVRARASNGRKSLPSA